MANNEAIQTKRADTLLEIQQLIGEIDSGNPDPDNIRKLKRLFDTAEGKALVERNSLTQKAFNAVFESVAETPGMYAIQRHNLKDRRADLNYDHAGLVERLLIDQVLLTETRLAHIELQLAAASREGTTGQRVLYYERQLNLVQKRLLRAVETLAKVRKLCRETEYWERRTWATGGGKTVEAHPVLSAGN